MKLENLENYHIWLDMESLWRNDHGGIEKSGTSGCTITEVPEDWVLEVTVRTVPLALAAE